MRLEDDVTCAELVELVTEYFEGVVSPEVMERFEEHLVICEGCSTHVQQMRETIRLTGVLTEADLDQHLSSQLLGLFRNWNAAA
jgi:putative zinc finger protein